jgi:Uma2 family endonuclease
MNSLTLQIPPTLKFSDTEFEELVAFNQELRLELTSQGELVVMPPTGGETGNRNFESYIDLGIWNRQTGLGKAFDSSTGFKLPNGATRSPDMSWVTIEKWEALTSAQKIKFLPLCPDFVLELVSETDDLEKTQAKMREYLENGLCLGWLINPKTKQVEIYGPHQEVEILNFPKQLSGEDVLPGFIFNLEQILL